MDVDTVGTFFAVLAIFCALGSAALVAARVSGADAGRRLLTWVGEVRNLLGALVALGSTLGSLYLSEVEGFIPCEYCWYQRIAMYPIVVVLGVAVVIPSASARWTATILAGAGTAIAAYHVQLQAFPDQSSSCDPTAPCTAVWLDVFGFIHIPTMALAGFVTILTVLWAPPTPQRSASRGE